MGISDSFITGITSGLVTALIIALFNEVWIKIISPWFEEKVYSDAKIEGQWEAVYPEINAKELIELKRVGHLVSGTMTAIEGPDKGKIYKFTGNFRNLILTATYISADKAYLDRGSFSLMLVKNGENLEGYSTFYEDNLHSVLSADYKWHKKG